MSASYEYFNSSQMECVSRYSGRCRRKRAQWPFAIRCVSNSHTGCRAYGTSLQHTNITVRCPPCRAVFDIDQATTASLYTDMFALGTVILIVVVMYMYLRRRRWHVRYA